MAVCAMATTASGRKHCSGAGKKECSVATLSTAASTMASSAATASESGKGGGGGDDAELASRTAAMYGKFVEVHRRASMRRMESMKSMSMLQSTLSTSSSSQLRRRGDFGRHRGKGARSLGIEDSDDDDDEEEEDPETSGTAMERTAPRRRGEQGEDEFDRECADAFRAIKKSSGPGIGDAVFGDNWWEFVDDGNNAGGGSGVAPSLVSGFSGEAAADDDEEEEDGDDDDDGWACFSVGWEGDDGRGEAPPPSSRSSGAGDAPSSSSSSPPSRRSLTSVPESRPAGSAAVAAAVSRRSVASEPTQRRRERSSSSRRQAPSSRSFESPAAISTAGGGGGGGSCRSQLSEASSAATLNLMERSLEEQLSSLTEPQFLCVQYLMGRWSRSKRHEVEMSDEVCLRFARNSPGKKPFHEKSAWRMLKNFDRRYLNLTVQKMEKQLRTGTLFPVPGLRTKEGQHETFYMKPSRYWPKVVETNNIIDNLAYVTQSMMQTSERACADGLGFVANMDGWTMEHFTVPYWQKFMTALQGRIFPLRIRLFLIVNPPPWFASIWKIMKAMLSPSFRKNVRIVSSAELDEHLMEGWEDCMPFDMREGSVDAKTIVSEFIEERTEIERRRASRGKRAIF